MRQVQLLEVEKKIQNFFSKNFFEKYFSTNFFEKNVSKIFFEIFFEKNVSKNFFEKFFSQILLPASSTGRFYNFLIFVTLKLGKNPLFGLFWMFFAINFKTTLTILMKFSTSVELLLQLLVSQLVNELVIQQLGIAYLKKAVLDFPDFLYEVENRYYEQTDRARFFITSL